jgi:hypothetical protein
MAGHRRAEKEKKIEKLENNEKGSYNLASSAYITTRILDDTHYLPDLPTTTSAPPFPWSRSGSTLAELGSWCDSPFAAFPFGAPPKWGSIGSEGGPWPDPEALVGVDVVAVVCVSALYVRKGVGATRGRWKRARNSFGVECEGSLLGPLGPPWVGNERLLGLVLEVELGP